MLVTRPKKRSRKMADRLEELGAEVILLPSIETRVIADNPQLEEALSRLSSYSWIGFTSSEGVDCFFDSLRKKRIDVRSLAGLRFAAIGPATGKAVERHGDPGGAYARRVQRRGHGPPAGGADEAGERILLPRARIGTRELLKPLEEAGISYDDIPVYDTLEGGPAEVSLLPGDIVTFTSASTVRGFVKRFPVSTTARCGGSASAPRRRPEAKKHGISVMVSERSDVESMVEKLLEIKGGTVKWK